METIKEFLPYVTSGLTGAAAAGAFSGPINTFQDWWYVNFGYKQSDKKAELIAKQEANVELLKRAILNETSEIDPENIQEPQLKILGPALEASKYYIEEEDLRIMFSKLIASSMDMTKNETMHSSFVEIIKQLNPIDAKILSEIQSGNIAIAQIGFNFETSGFTIQYKHLYSLNQNEYPHDNIEASMDNLIRLGLIDVDYGTYSKDESLYDSLKLTSEYKEIEQTMDSIDESKKRINENTIPSNSIGDFINFKEIRFEKGIVETTKFGKNFCDICLSN